MEERILDKEEGRGIKLKRTADGETDATDALAEDGEEVVLDLPETDEYDEDLVGLTPSQLKEELERRERAAQRAREESERFAAEGRKKLAAEEYGAAEELFERALLADAGNREARNDLWTARTCNFTSAEKLYEEGIADELLLDGEAHAAVLEKMGDTLAAEKENYVREAEPLRPAVEEARAERREAFRRNKNYYLVRFAICFAICVLFAVGVGISADYILRIQNAVPVILTAVFGIAAFAMLAVSAAFAAKTIVAWRLCARNEDLSSTEDGARLADLQQRVAALEQILSPAEETEEEE